LQKCIIFKEVQEALKDDPFDENIKKYLCINEVDEEFEFDDELLYFKGLLYEPTRPI
jgi:hypothetical protein